MAATGGPQALAEKIAQKVAETLEPLEREMIIMKWPSEYRVIFWQALSIAADRLAAESK